MIVLIHGMNYLRIAPKSQRYFFICQKFILPVYVFNFQFNYKRIIKEIGDYFNLGILASVQAQLFPNQKLKKEKRFQDLTHNIVSSVRFSNGIRDVTLDYENLSNNEFNNDYSMGYLNHFGFRAGTATPFNFYDISNEFQLPLKSTSNIC